MTSHASRFIAVAPRVSARPLRHSARWASIVVTLLVAHTGAGAQSLPAACGQLKNAYGPFDYRTSKDKLQIVEAFHFTPQVESLIRGQSAALGGDLDYTLRASPNHHRALLALMRLSARQQSEQLAEAHFPVACYFSRAVAFAPDDATVRMLYATYLESRRSRDQALLELAAARNLAGDSGFTHYNIGLVYADFGEFDKALAQAHEALRLGFTWTQLKERLVAAGKWKEPAAQATP